jgi:hypothetical protein
LSIELRREYEKMLEAFELRQRQIDRAKAEGKEADIVLPPKPTFDAFVNQYMRVGIIARTSAEGAEQAWGEFRKTLEVTTKGGEALYSLLSDMSEETIKRIGVQPEVHGAEDRRLATRQFGMELAEISNQYQVQSTLLKALGADEVNLARLRVQDTDEQIRKTEEQLALQKKGTAEFDTLQAQLHSLRLRRTLEETGVVVAGINQQRQAYQDYFNLIETETKQQFELQKLSYQIQGRSQEEILQLEKESIETKREQLRAQLAFNQATQMLFPFSVALTEEEKKKLEEQYRALGFTAQEIELKIQLLSVEKQRTEILEEFANNERLLASLGYTNIEVKQMQLNTAREMLANTKEENEVQRKSLEDLIEQLETDTLILGRDKERERINREILYLEQEVTNLPRLLQSYLLEESYREKLRLAQAENNIVKANVYQRKIEELQNDRNIEQLRTMQQVSGFISDNIYGLVTGTQSWGDVMKSVNEIVLKKSIEYLTMMLLRMIAMKMLGLAFGGGGGGGDGGDGGGGVRALTPETDIPGFGMNIAANGAVWKGGFQSFGAGGTVRQPTLGLIGEGKYNEAIVPLPDGRKIPVDLKGQGQERPEITIVNAIDPSFISAAVASDPNTIINIVNSDLMRNGMTRKVIRGGG